MQSSKGILKETWIVSSVQIVRLAFGLIRNKLIALYFGGAGLGIWALFVTFTEVLQQLIGMGIDKAGVKKISENKKDEKKRNQFVFLLRFSIFFNSILICSLLGLLFGFGFLSNYQRESDSYYLYLIIYAFLNCNFICYCTVLNAIREVKLYAKSQFYGMFLSNLIIFCLLSYIQVEQLIYCFLIQALGNILSSMYFYNKVKSRISFNFSNKKNILAEFKSLIKLGMGFWIPALYLALTEYLIRLYISKNLSVEVLGIYQACWTISNMYVGILLSSMAVTFYPRLCEIINDVKKTNELLNKQISLCLNISLPLLLIIIIFPSEILTLLYSSGFESGDSIIQWQIAGVLMRIFGFSFGYALMAKGKIKNYMLIQFLFSTCNILFMVLIVDNYQEKYLGLSYFLSYSVYLVFIFLYCFKNVSYRMEGNLVINVIILLGFIALGYMIEEYLENIALYSCTFILITLTFYVVLKEMKFRHGVDFIRMIKGGI